MSISEASRHQLFQRLEEVLGSQEATVLMEHLPPVGWADVATRRDLDHLEAILRADLTSTESRMTAQLAALDARVTTELTSQLREQRNQLFTAIGAMTAIISVALVVVGLG